MANNTVFTGFLLGIRGLYRFEFGSGLGFALCRVHYVYAEVVNKDIFLEILEFLVYNKLLLKSRKVVSVAKNYRVEMLIS